MNTEQERPRERHTYRIHLPVEFMKLLGKYDYEDVAAVMKIVAAESYIADKRANLEDERARSLEVARKLGVAAEKHTEEVEVEEASTEEEVEIDSLLYLIVSTNFKRESRILDDLRKLGHLKGFGPIPELLETLYQFHNNSKEDAHFDFIKEIRMVSTDS